VCLSVDTTTGSTGMIHYTAPISHFLDKQKRQIGEQCVPTRCRSPPARPLNVNTCKKTAYTGWSCGGTLGSNKRDFFLSRSLLRCSAATANGNELLKQKQQNSQAPSEQNNKGDVIINSALFFLSFFFRRKKKKRKNIPR